MKRINIPGIYPGVLFVLSLLSINSTCCQHDPPAQGEANTSTQKFDRELIRAVLMDIDTGRQHVRDVEIRAAINNLFSYTHEYYSIQIEDNSINIQATYRAGNLYPISAW